MKLSNEYAWIIPLCPLIASCCTGSLSFFFPRVARGFHRLCALLNVFSLAISMFVSLAIFQEQFVKNPIQQYLWIWIPRSTFCVEIGFLVDSLTLVMSLLVTTVGVLVMIYSDSYMCYDRGYTRFYAYLSLFTASMLGLVLSPNLIQLYVFWELVGMCSYLLVGFWFARSSAANACQKAFVTNRIGDFGLLLGILGIYWTTGSFEISELCDRFAKLKEIGFSNPILTNIIAFLLLAGPVAKSAQFPLHVWLPDAMEGPTPISALIHAATMVAAGIFFIARIYGLISTLPLVMQASSWLGGATALLGATLALAQRDLKKGLAYSTMSQLGYMVLALGIGAYQSALFHLVTHAYSKALLFLGAGSVIHSIEKVVGYSPNRSQNMFFMGGLRKYMPITGTTFLLGTLSLSGIPPLACFWSKDEIIHESWLSSLPLGILASGTAGLTAFYMFRIYLLTFEGDFCTIKTDWVDFNHFAPLSISMWGETEGNLSLNQINQNVASVRLGITKNKGFSSSYLANPNGITNVHYDQSLPKPKESSSAMTFSLVMLAIPTTLVGLLGINLIGETANFELSPEWLINPVHFFELSKSFNIYIKILLNSRSSLILSFFGIFFSFIIYKKSYKYFYITKKLVGFTKLVSKFGLLVQSWSLNRGYIDYYYDICFVRNLRSLSKSLSDFDRYGIDGFVNVIGALNFFGGEFIRYGENGRISYYLFIIIFGAILSSVLIFIFLPFP
uniref:NAD(P)H-quinone oxidoreductase subunit 5, chloroplastic n=1 Tax=Adiantum capillus-veneris TaxID=13818 RepID=NU5C_ADICA|nr:NADH dehydrogenase subunit 5 [Adiantum capillus-veneris]Q85FH9.2 RecName: Full=NAD(P)H-quinone oxidoreductase subunit 5, chloroplastic; AltName: Full=NAD(P)H dehydrogenase subunit 5; AltName: Full=NADH-plastoquinone oxidoreductase subunit 5 [Adiantum capillus-veneris]AAP29437.2 NADH dehydrogenase subunit 5 [Adiantum capillus-veneris]